MIIVMLIASLTLPLSHFTRIQSLLESFIKVCGVCVLLVTLVKLVFVDCLSLSLSLSHRPLLHYTTSYLCVFLMYMYDYVIYTWPLVDYTVGEIV